MILALFLQAFVGITCNSVSTGNIRVQCVQVATAPPFTLFQPPLVYWRLDEVSGTRFDVFAVDNLTDVNTVTSAVGKISNAASFAPASLERLHDPSATQNLPGDFTISFWINPTTLVGAGSEGRGIAGSHTGENIGDWSLAVRDDGSILFYYWASAGDDSNGRSWTNPGIVTVGTFQHIVLRRWNDDFTVWRDGGTVFIIFTTGTGTGFGINGFNIGCNVPSVTAGDYWSGLIDEFGIWGRALSDAEITYLYNSGNGRTYPF